MIHQKTIMPFRARSRRGCQESNGTGSLASAKCSVAADNGSRSHGGSYGAESGSSSSVAGRDDGRAASLADAVRKWSCRGGGDHGEDCENLDKLHCWYSCRVIGKAVYFFPFGGLIRDLFRCFSSVVRKSQLFHVLGWGGRRKMETASQGPEGLEEQPGFLCLTR